MTKKQITPKQTIYRLSYLSNDFSISEPFDTLADAKHEAYELMYGQLPLIKISGLYLKLNKLS